MKKYLKFFYIIMNVIIIQSTISNAVDFSKFREFRDQEKYTDITLVDINKKKHPCHKLILAGFSEYFQIMFDGEMKESQQKEVNFGYSSEATEIILDFIYNPDKDRFGFPIDPDIYFELLDFYKIHSIHKCRDKLKTALNSAIIDISKESITGEILYKIVIHRDEKILNDLLPAKYSNFFAPVTKNITKIYKLSPIEKIVFNKDGSRAAALLEDNYIHMYDTSDGTIVATIENDSPVKTFALSGDGSRIITTDTSPESSNVKVYDALNGESIFKAKLKDYEIQYLKAVLNYDGSLMALVTGRTVKVLGIDGKEKITRQKWFYINWVAFSPDNTHIVVTSDGVADIWNILDGTLKVTLKDTLNVHGSKIISATFNEDGSRVITTSQYITSIIRNAFNGELISTLMAGVPFAPASAFFSPDGTCVVTIHNNGVLLIMDAHSGKKLGSISSKFDPKSGVAFLDNFHILTISEDKEFVTWVLPPKELVSDEVLFNSENSFLWLAFKYYFITYMNDIKDNEKPSYDKFTKYIDDEDVRSFIDDLNQNHKEWKAYFSQIFKDML